MDVRVALSGELFEGGMQRIHLFAKIIEMLGEWEGLPDKGRWWETPLSTLDKSIRARGPHSG